MISKSKVWWTPTFSSAKNSQQSSEKHIRSNRHQSISDHFFQFVFHSIFHLETRHTPVFVFFLMDLYGWSPKKRWMFQASNHQKKKKKTFSKAPTAAAWPPLRVLLQRVRMKRRRWSLQGRGTARMGLQLRHGRTEQPTAWENFFRWCWNLKPWFFGMWMTLVWKANQRPSSLWFTSYFLHACFLGITLKVSPAKVKDSALEDHEGGSSLGGIVRPCFEPLDALVLLQVHTAMHTLISPSESFWLLIWFRRNIMT